MNQADLRQESSVHDPLSPDFYDPVIEVYKMDIDRSLLRENLKLTPEERSRKFERNMRMIFELRRVAKRRRDQSQMNNDSLTKLGSPTC